MNSDDEKNTKTIFHCINRNSGEIMQGISYSDGSQTIGIDAWRLLYRTDYPSYPLYEYQTRAQLLNDVRLINKHKGYFLDLNEPKEEYTNVRLSSFN